MLNADFDPSPDTAYLTSAGQQDIFISKLDSNGNYVWAKSMGGTDYDYANGISVDSSGNVYTTGTFLNTVDFDPGPNDANLSSVGWNDIFISKLDGSGNYVWARAWAARAMIAAMPLP
ncbi:MAG: SBBP repeat-containing protein [Anaerolineales bacterium]|nr:SBBP repeat-containing protein [Anaerolineales bacterium]